MVYARFSDCQLRCTTVKDVRRRSKCAFFSWFCFQWIFNWCCSWVYGFGSVSATVSISIWTVCLEYTSLVVDHWQAVTPPAHDWIAFILKFLIKIMLFLIVLSKIQVFFSNDVTINSHWTNYYFNSLQSIAAFDSENEDEFRWDQNTSRWISAKGRNIMLKQVNIWVIFFFKYPLIGVLVRIAYRVFEHNITLK